MTPLDRQAHDLMLAGTLCFADMESTGFRVDVPYYTELRTRLQMEMDEIEQGLLRMPEVREWRNAEGPGWSLISDAQVARFIYDRCGVPEPEYGRKTDAEHLRDTGLECVDKLIEWRKKQKVLGTYVLPYIRENVDGMIHPFYNLNTVRSYRPSGQDPNLLNVPKRDEEIKNLVRGGILPLPGYQFLEADYSAAEVRVGNCIHKDERMFIYNRTPGSDMHRDSAAELFFYAPSEVPKPIRRETKGWFVFAQFYGDYYVRCAQNLWKNAVVPDLCGCCGQLAKHGITEYAQFEKHVQKFESKFWDEWFCGYRDWKKRNWKFYCEHGYIDTPTGFRCGGLMDEKQVNNYPAQSAAFHCLLWSLIQINLKLKARGMKSRLWCMVYDSLVMHLWPSELADVIDIVKPVMEDRVKTQYPWLEVPMIAEFELGRRNAPWSEISEIEV